MKRFSLLTDDMTKCYLTGSTRNIHIHEVFFGTAHRKRSIEWGCCVPLTQEMHTGAKGVHNNRALDLKLKKEMQRAFEKKYSHEKFMSIFHKSWI